MNFVIGLLMLAGWTRRRAKAIVTLFALHFLVLIVVQLGIQNYHKTLLHPANAMTGLAMIGFLALIVWMQGGPLLDGIFILHATTKRKTPRTLVRLLIGFFTVESFVNVCFCVIPFYANHGAFGLLLVAGASYFMFRFMAGMEVDWGKWVWFPILNVVVALAVIAKSYMEQNSISPTAWIPSFGDFETWGAIAIALGITYVIVSSKKPSTGAPKKSGGDHH